MPDDLPLKTHEPRDGNIFLHRGGLTAFHAVHAATRVPASLGTASTLGLHAAISQEIHSLTKQAIP